MNQMVPLNANDMKREIGKMQAEFGKSLPGHISAEKFVRTTQTAISLTRNIEKVKDLGSLLAACTNAAADGLILDGREAALVVDYNGGVSYRPMMRGLLKLAHNSGAIKSLVVETVRQNDTFVYSPTNEHPIHHVIELRQPRGEIYAVYAMATLTRGGIIHEVMSLEDVNGIRDRSDAYRAFKAGKIKSTPWSTDWSEMARKTVFRRLSKYLPSSTDRDAIHQAAERIDDDYQFEATDGGPTEPVQVKRRGAAAEALRDITPAEPVSPQPEPQPTAEVHDIHTGEILEPFGPANATPDKQPEEDF